MATTVAPLRRLILVRDASNIPAHIHLAACILNSRVQEKLMTPMLQCSLDAPLVLAFTPNFAQQHKDVVGVAKVRVGLHCTSSSDCSLLGGFARFLGNVEGRPP